MDKNGAERMPPSSRPPEEQPRVKPFDPLVLDRTVIALPLLRAMKEDFDHIKVISEAHPAANREFNTAIQYNAAYPGGPEAARRLVEEMATRAAQKAMDVARHQLANAGADVRERLEKRLMALEEGVRTQRIGPLMTDGLYGFAVLDASVVRRILNENERLASSDPPSPPILLLGPTRFEVIIDLNLEHPIGREAARRWVIEHIEQAKVDAGVRDAGQDMHWEKDNPNSQYLFARLEGRAIQKLVDSTSPRRRPRPKRVVRARGCVVESADRVEEVPGDLSHLA